jgi:7,8-dihydropterin-6-yl-methyl-4-(beta-D-ribofuranosyl)aminobenzene 5'-phosphate synthase
MMTTVRITVLVENMARGRHRLGEHGLSFYIEAGPQRVLFDTGQGRALRNNAEVLGIDLESLDAVVLSHGHYDHSGGFAALPARSTTLPVFVHPAAFDTKFSRHPDGSVHDVGLPDPARAALAAGTIHLVETRKPTEVVANILATGTIPRHTQYEDVGGAFFTDPACTLTDPLPDDQALALRTPQGVVVLLGCAHSGVVNTMDYIAGLLNEGRIHAVIGGMHLMRASKERIKATIEALEHYDVRLIAPCHCTGISATAAMWHHFTERCHECSVGTVFEFT